MMWPVNKNDVACTSVQVYKTKNRKVFMKISYLNRRFFVFICPLLFICFSISFGQTTRYVDYTASGANDGTSWANAHTELYYGLQASIPGDSILVAQGVYKPTNINVRDSSFMLKGWQKVLGGYPNGGGARDFKNNPTTLSGDIGVIGDSSDNSYNVVKIFNEDQAVLDGFIIEGGYANGGGDKDYGGGIYMGMGWYNETVRNCIIRNNYAKIRGGGIFSKNLKGLIENCRIYSNVSDSNGGGVFMENDSTHAINCTFVDNHAILGGAIYVLRMGSGADSIVNCTFVANKAVYGGGFYNDNTGTGNPAIINSILWHNEASDSGHEICNISGSMPGFMNSDIKGCGGSALWAGLSFGQDNGGNLDTFPRFFDVDGFDNIVGTADDSVKLQDGSPCVMKGIGPGGIIPSTDIEGYGRGAQPTLGAYEQTVMPASGKTWENVAGDGLWSNDINWYPDGVPSNSDTVIIDGANTNDACSLDITDTIASIYFNDGVDFPGPFNFTSCTLSVYEDASFFQATTIIAGTGMLAFIGAINHVFTPKAGEMFPVIYHNGTSTTFLSTYSFRSKGLIISSGTIDLGSYGAKDTVDYFQGYGGGLYFGGTELYINGEADFYYISSIMPDSGKLVFNGSGAQDFTPCSNNFPDVVVSNTSNVTVLDSNSLYMRSLTIGTSALFNAPTNYGMYIKGSFVNYGTFSHNNGYIQFDSTSGYHTVNPGGYPFHEITFGAGGSMATYTMAGPLYADTLIVDYDTLNLGSFTHNIGVISYGMMSGLNFNTCSLRVNSNADFSGFDYINTGTGVLEFAASDTQTLKLPYNQTLPAILHSGAGKLKLDYDTYDTLVAVSFAQTAGQLDLYYQNMEVSGDFKIENGTDSTFISLAGRKITVGGNARFEGSSGSLLNFNPESPCTLNVTGSLVAYYSTLGNCHATGSAGTADNSCVDGSNNINWSWADLRPPVNAATYPKIGSVVRTTATFLVNINETGTAYFVLVPNGAPAPSSFQVSLGQDASSTPAAFSGNSAVAANVEDTLVASGLNSLTTYDAYIVAKDAFNNLQDTPVKLTFTSGDGIAPTVVSFNPQDNGTGVGLSNNLVITFGEIVNKGSGNITIAKSSDMSVFEAISVGSANVTGNGTATITINPSATFASETGYYVLIANTCFVDTAGNQYAGITANTTWNFTTVDVLTETPTLSAPGNGGNVDDTFNIDFSLPEAALSGSVKMTFSQSGGASDPNSPHVITFIAAYETAGSHSTVLLGENLSNNGNVSSVSSDPNDALVKDAVYDVMIEYQDANGNSVARATNLQILYIGGDLGNDVGATLTNSDNNAVIVSLTRSTTPISSVEGIYFALHLDTAYLDTANAIGLNYSDTTFIVSNITTEGTYYGAWALFDSSGNVGLMRYDSVAIGNAAPVLSLPAVDTAYEDSLWMIANFASDLNNDPLDLLLLSAPTGMSISSSSQTITWTPAHNDVGSHTVIVRADDRKGGIDTDTMTLRVLRTNVSPVLSLPGPATIPEDSAWAIDNFVSDINGDSITLVLSNAPASMTVSQSDLSITWTPGNDDVGTYNITVVASDPKGAADTALMNITVINTNDYPVIFSASFPDTVYEDSLVQGVIAVSDPDDGDTVFLTFSPDVPWLDISVTQGSTDSIWQFNVKGIPTDAYTGSIQFSSYVSDKGGLVVTANHQIFVINTNDPPNTLLNKKDLAYGAVLYNMKGVDDFDTVLTFCATITGSASRFDSSMTNTSGLFPIYPLVDGRYIFSCYTKDKKGLVDLTPVKDTITVSGVSTHTWSDSSVWDMVSIPALSYNAAPLKSAGVILHWDESRDPSGIYKYYTRSDGIHALTAGKSYWARLNSAVTATLHKDSLCKDSIPVYLHKSEYGWNQIASPYTYPVRCSKLDALWEWDPLTRDFILNTTGILYPWHGYWAHTEAVDTVFLSPNPLFVAKDLKRQSRTCFENTRAWTFGIELTTNVNRDADNLFGVNKKARDGYDVLDRPEPPRMGSEPYLSFAHPEWKRSIDRFASDIRRTWDSKVNIFQIGISPCERDVTALTLNITGFNEEAPIYLFVNTPSGIIEYKPGTALGIEPSGKEQYRTIFATANKGFINTFPHKFILNSPYPNPCRPMTTMRYTLPYNWGNNGWLDTKPYRVRMIIYDAKGRVVRELVNRKQKPGHYKIVWRGKGDTGRYVASGTYFCRLTAGKYSSVKKIIAIR